MPAYTYSDVPIDPAEARQVLVESGLLTIEQYNALTAELRGIAFSMARIRDLAGLARIRAQLVTALSEGWSAGDFIRWCRTEGHAWERAYSELVFRNAVSGAYSRGRFVQMMTPAMARRFPVLFYDAVRDARTTELCRNLDGKWWFRNKFPMRLWPPNHHACRSVVRQMTAQQARMRSPQGGPQGGMVGDAPPAGWDGNSAELWQTSLDNRELLLRRAVGV